MDAMVSVAPERLARRYARPKGLQPGWPFCNELVCHKRLTVKFPSIPIVRSELEGALHDWDYLLEGLGLASPGQT